MTDCIQNDKSNLPLKFWTSHSGVVNRGRVCVLLKYDSNFLPLLTETQTHWNNAKDKAYYEINTPS